MGTASRSDLGGLTASPGDLVGAGKSLSASEQSISDALYSTDAHGRVHSFQYFPSISATRPKHGSLAGGTEVTITGGGFSPRLASNSVLVAGRRCEVVSAALEQIVCRTAPSAEGTPATVASMHAVTETPIVKDAVATGAACAPAWPSLTSLLLAVLLATIE